MKYAKCIKCSHYHIVEDLCYMDLCDYDYLCEKKKPRRRESDIARDLFGDIISAEDDLI